MATLIKIGNVLEYEPLKRSPERLAEVVRQINNPKVDAKYLQADFALFMAGILKERVRDSIKTQKVNGVHMKSLYKPLNKAYKKSKPYGTKTKFWVNTHHLVDSLTVWRTGNVIRIGFKGRAYYPDTRLRVLLVVLWMERGTSNMPARPLFTPHARTLSKGVGRYFETYLKMRFGIVLPA